MTWTHHQIQVAEEQEGKGKSWEGYKLSFLPLFQSSIFSLPVCVYLSVFNTCVLSQNIVLGHSERSSSEKVGRESRRADWRVFFCSSLLEARLWMSWTLTVRGEVREGIRNRNPGSECTFPLMWGWLPWPRRTGNQSLIFTGRIDTESETPILWPPDAKNWLTGKDPDTGKDWRQQEKGMTEDKMIRWHH